MPLKVTVRPSVQLSNLNPLQSCVRSNLRIVRSRNLLVSATASVEVEMAPKVVFDSAAAEARVKDLRTVFKSGKTKSLQWRERQLRAIESFIVENQEEILQALAKDLGKPRIEAVSSDVSNVQGAAAEARKNLKKWSKATKVSTNLLNFPAKSYLLPEPLGVVLVISPWNYPFMLALEPVIGAIAAGNSVILKPSEMAPATSAVLAKLAAEYLDSDAIAVIEGGVEEATALLEQKWDKIFCTGSSAVGRVVAMAAAKHLTPVTLELGGKCPAIVDATVDVKIAARRIAFGRFFNAGQTCTALDYVLVEESIAPKLVEALKATLLEWYGAPEGPSPDLARIVHNRHFKRIQGYLEDPAVKERIVFGGKMDESQLYVSPTLVLDPPLDSPLLTEEIFGPVLPIVSVRNVGQAIEIVAAKPKPLTVYPFTANKEVARLIISETSSGAVCVNDAIVHVSNSKLPFGGVGESGYGVYHGKHSFDCFSHCKAVMEKDLGFDLPARFPPYTRQKETIIRAILNGDIIGALLAILGFRK